MADYHAILRRALAAMPSPNGEVRRAVYEKARTALVAQLKAFDPPLSPSEITQQRLQLEDAIRRVESEAAKGLLRAPPAAPPVKPPVEPVTAPQEPLESPHAVPAAAPPPPPIQASAAAEPARVAPPPVPPAPPPPPPPPPPPLPVETKPSGEAMKRAVDAAGQLGAATAELGRQARGALDEGKAQESASGSFARAAEPPQRKSETEERRKRREKVRTGEEGEGERKRLPVVVGIAVAVLVFAIGIVALWTQREAISAFLGGSPEQVLDITKRQSGEKLAPKNADRLAGADEAGKPAAAKPVPTQTITTTPQLATQPTQAPAQPTQAPAQTTTQPVQTTPQATEAPKPVAPMPQQPVALVAQKAILYEEGKIGGQALISPGRIIWQTAPDPTDPKPGAIQLKARIEIPDRKLVVDLSMHPNADTSFPASHMVELRFDVPPDFDGKSVTQVPGLILKPTEQARGDGLSGAAAKVADNLFWVALGAAEADRSRNLKLLKERGWIDVPLLYETGRRAILTLEKAGAGDQVFSDALNAWGNGG